MNVYCHKTCRQFDCNNNTKNVRQSERIKKTNIKIPARVICILCFSFLNVKNGAIYFILIDHCGKMYIFWDEMESYSDSCLKLNTNCPTDRSVDNSNQKIPFLVLLNLFLYFTGP
ncbi:conserved hypothetical protein [Trichinella spiralis]|uniref:hypothetical protein n=1 Tax=Trichinella spiralis TaxID=6334 RepID=UPI0001EFB773|nr:conserved hypothetical protein [Trichinella spiralis]